MCVAFGVRRLDAAFILHMLSAWTSGLMHPSIFSGNHRMDGTPGRRVWYQYFDSHITYQRSYLARLKYVHQHGVHHRLVGDAENYPWCSASWFARKAKPSFCRTVAGFKIDRVNVMDPFEPIAPQPERESGVKPPHSESIATAS